MRTSLSKLRSLRGSIRVLWLLLLLLCELRELLRRVLLSVLLRIASKLLTLLSLHTSLLRELSLGERLLILLVLQCLGILLGRVLLLLQKTKKVNIRAPSSDDSQADSSLSHHR